MNARNLLLAAPLLFGVALGASAVPQNAPKHALHSRPTVTGGPFRDVPPNHWAAKSVETLRRAGIVKGYPLVRGQRAR